MVSSLEEEWARAGWCGRQGRMKDCELIHHIFLWIVPGGCKCQVRGGKWFKQWLLIILQLQVCFATCVNNPLKKYSLKPTEKAFFSEWSKIREASFFSSDSESDDSGQESISAQKKRKKQKMMSWGMEKCEEEEVGEPIWLEDNDSEEEEEVSLVNQSAMASQSTLSTQNISLNALKTFAGTVHSASICLQSLDISSGDWCLECPIINCPSLDQI